MKKLVDHEIPDVIRTLLEANGDTDLNTIKERLQDCFQHGSPSKVHIELT